MTDKPLTAADLADALGCFWNAAIGEAHNQQDAFAVASIMATGIAAVQARLVEISQPEKLEEWVVLRASAAQPKVVPLEDALIAALKPFAAVADAFDANELDDEARKWWGSPPQIRTNVTPHDQIELYSGRGGRRLITLQDCMAAREAINAKEAK